MEEQHGDHREPAQSVERGERINVGVVAFCEDRTLAGVLPAGEGQ